MMSRTALANKILTVLALVACSATHASASEKWNYNIKPYGWYVWFDGSTGADGEPPIESDSGLIDVLDGFFLIQGAAQRGKFSLLAEFNWVEMSDDLSIAFVPAGWNLEGYMVALGASYAVYEQNETRVEIAGGVRHWDVTVDTRLGPRDNSASTTITDPFLGFRLATPINDRFSFHAQGSYGTGGDSENQYDIGAEVRWKWLESTDLAVGYRHLKLDFDKDAVLVDGTLYGPYVALNFRF